MLPRKFGNNIIIIFFQTNIFRYHCMFILNTAKVSKSHRPSYVVALPLSVRLWDHDIQTPTPGNYYTVIMVYALQFISHTASISRTTWILSLARSVRANSQLFYQGPWQRTVLIGQLSVEVVRQFNTYLKL